MFILVTNINWLNTARPVNEFNQNFGHLYILADYKGFSASNIAYICRKPGV